MADDDVREIRVAENEATFREANESLRGVFEDTEAAPLQPYPFLCECGDRGCTTVVLLELAQYEQIRQHPARFLISPGHKQLATEKIVNSGEGYEVIQKHGAAAEIARAHWNRLSTER